MGNNIKDRVIMSEANTTLQTISSVSKEFEVFKTEIYKTQERCFLLNNIYYLPDDVRVIFSEIIGQNIGSDFVLLPPFYCDYGKNIVIGKNVFVNMGCTFMDLGGIILDDNVMIAPNCQLITENHGIEPGRRDMLYNRSIHVCKNVWIGAGTTILPGVTIGKNSIVAAGSVVTKSVPDNKIVAGNPARIIKNIEEISYEQENKNRN